MSLKEEREKYVENYFADLKNDFKNCDDRLVKQLVLEKVKDERFPQLEIGRLKYGLQDGKKHTVEEICKITKLKQGTVKKHIMTYQKYLFFMENTIDMNVLDLVYLDDPKGPYCQGGSIFSRFRTAVSSYFKLDYDLDNKELAKDLYAMVKDRKLNVNSSAKEFHEIVRLFDEKYKGKYPTKKAKENSWNDFAGLYFDPDEVGLDLDYDNGIDYTTL